MRAIAEAPSKVIITGEHFVVHGAWALAAALPRRVRVEVEVSDKFEVDSDRFRRGSPQLRPLANVVDALAREFSVSSRVKVSIESSIPEGAGLGSSAATMVAVTSAMSRLYSLGLGVGDTIRFSMVGEKDIHGRPSGIDPTISAQGGVLLFSPGKEPRKISFDGPRSLIVSYSGVNRSTKAEIGKVSRIKEDSPRRFSSLTESVSGLSLAASEKLKKGDMKGLGKILTSNQAALESIGVSSGTLESMIDLLLSGGAYGAKLTGAGGGGSVVAVAPKAKEKSIVSGLSARGFETFRARIPVEGVKSWLRR